jgi:hypothetical protein
MRLCIEKSSSESLRTAFGYFERGNAVPYTGKLKHDIELEVKNCSWEEAIVPGLARPSLVQVCMTTSTSLV